MNILISGANGFIGRALVKKMSCHNLSACGRNDKGLPSNCLFHYVDISPTTDYSNAVLDIDVVIHTAARVHLMKESSSEPLREFRKVNAEGTLNFARQSAESGVKRFIFISSIKVNGERTTKGNLFTANDEAKPEDPYGISKAEAEERLKALAADTGMEVVIIRPTLVYGPGVKANFAAMMKLASKGIPLPFGAIKENRRSLVSIDNLVDLIVTCIDHLKAANETFLVSDNEDLSTTDMFSRLSKACGKSTFLIPIPISLFEKVFRLIGKPEIYLRLCGSLQVDISDTMQKLGWKPPYSTDECFAKTAKHYLEKE